HVLFLFHHILLLRPLRDLAPARPRACALGCLVVRKASGAFSGLVLRPGGRALPGPPHPPPRNAPSPRPRAVPSPGVTPPHTPPLAPHTPPLSPRPPSHFPRRSCDPRSPGLPPSSKGGPPHLARAAQCPLRRRPSPSPAPRSATGRPATAPRRVPGARHSRVAARSARPSQRARALRATQRRARAAPPPAQPRPAAPGR